jgi:hypothetical protein
VTARDNDPGRLVRVDSAEEQYAYMLAHFGAPGTWEVTSQQFDLATDGREVEIVDVRAPDGAVSRVRFVSRRSESPFETTEETSGTDFLDTVMESAFAFSAENPPHHPGTVARFPVPSASYANSLSVPLPVLAVEGGRRGLYAPPRVVVLAFDTLEANWPPTRLGDWPPPGLAGKSQQEIQSTIMRFSAVWKRILEAWFASDVVESPDLAPDAHEAIQLLDVLDLPAMIPNYTRLNQVFWRWLVRHSTAGPAAAPNRPGARRRCPDAKPE